MSNIFKSIEALCQIEHGFKHIVDAGDAMLQDGTIDSFQLATALLVHPAYQARMLATYLFGAIAAENPEALKTLKEVVAKDENWRVQEMLAKAFDQYCKNTGYENALSVIKDWLQSKSPNVVRAVYEGLRIWTARPYFKQNPSEAIALLGIHKSHESEYVRRSVGNALRDISRKHADLVERETQGWDLTDIRILFTHKLVMK